LGWKNLNGLSEATTKLAEKSPTYVFNVKNLAREWVNAFTYFVGFTTENIGRSRIILKAIASLFFVWMFVKFCRLTFSVNKQMLKIILVLSAFFMTIESAFTHHLYNFIPHYLIYLVPLFIWEIALSISELSFLQVRSFISSSK
jgi:hypothetical protein